MSILPRSIVCLAAAFTLIAGAARAQAPRQVNPNQTEMTQAINSYSLTSDNVRKTAAAYDKLAEAMAKDPESIRKYAEQVRGRDEHFSLDRLVQNIDSIPPVANAIHSADLDTRTFLMTTFAMAQAAPAAQMAKQRPDMMNRMQGRVNMQNVEWVNSHPDDVKSFMESSKRLQVMHQRAGGDEK